MLRMRTSVHSRPHLVRRRVRCAVEFIPAVVVEQLEARLLLTFDPSPAEQELLEHINRMRMDPQAELDVFFTSHPSPLTSSDPLIQSAIDFFNVDGDVLAAQWASLTAVAPLTWSESLSIAAAGHNDRMIAADLQLHQVPGEAPLGERITAAGYDWNAIGENIFAFAETVFEAHAAFAIDWGFNPPSGIQAGAGHRANIMSVDFQEIGLAVTPENNSATDVGPLVITQDFGGSGISRDAFLLGVVFDDTNNNDRYDSGEGLGSLQIDVISGDGTEYSGTTLSAGGYQIAVPPGTYTIRVSGGGLGGTLERQGIQVLGRNGRVGDDLVNHNVKVDFETSELNSTSLQWNLASDRIAEDAGGQATTASLTRTGDLSNELVVYLRAADESEAATPPSVVFAAGQSVSPEFAIGAIDDAILDGTVQTLLQASTLPFNQSGDAITAEIQFFVSDVEQVVAIGPQGTITDASPMFSWNPLNGATSYRLDVLNAAGDTIVLSRDGISGTTFEFPDVLAEAAYQFRVQGVNAAGDVSLASEPLVFDVQIPRPAPPALIAPAATISDRTPLLAWTSTAFAARYDLWVDQVGVKSQTIRETSLTTNQFEALVELPLGTYRAWVRAFNEVGEGSSWSAAWQFEILSDVPTPAAPELQSPYSVVSDTTPEFRWNAVNHATRYDLWVGRKGETQPVLRNMFVTGTSYIPTNELGMGEYEAFVRAFNSENESGNWSAVLPFEIVTDVPVPAAPVLVGNPAVTSDTTPLISWVSDTNAAWFDVWIDRVGGSNVYRNRSVIGTDVTVTTQLATGTYRVWVRAVNSESERSNWSASFDFQIVNDVAVPQTPVIHAPYSYISDRRPVIRWTPDSNAFRYSLWLQRAGSSTPLYYEQQLYAAEFQPPADLPLGGYTVWVRATNAEGERSEWSDPLSFTVVSDVLTPTVPEFIDPPKYISDQTPLLEWTGVDQAAYYDVWLSEVGEPTALVRERQVLSSQLQIDTSLPYGEYDVWVRAFNSEGERSSWSNSHRIVVMEDVPEPLVVSLLGPSGYVSDTTPTFQWSESLFASEYEVWLGLRGSSTPVLRVRQLRTLEFTPAEPLAYGNYEFWVRASNSEGEFGPWGSPLSFTLGPADTASLFDADRDDNDLEPDELERELMLDQLPFAALDAALVPLEGEVAADLAERLAALGIPTGLVPDDQDSQTDSTESEQPPTDAGQQHGGAPTGIDEVHELRAKSRIPVDGDRSAIAFPLSRLDDAVRDQLMSEWPLAEQDLPERFV